ncbi:histidine phosphatase family protein [Cellulomonas marina]|uniref:Broad specificity phosphatase PhoE n=1 Tax=Cellulomonas marina TaxID=988821 RepID=A0A1I1AFA6_9CELL|nr:histidine phosphatase family protein [Cellulomonas marina]GIG29700.1 phosphoglycerate mutase [Cellulomonas marina]SFB36162.1 Broad specificity phosphatase PhoE [Cellulomonas marina]
MLAPTSPVRTLWLVRHGESLGNVAASEAERTGSEVVDVATRDADTPLSDRGREQAAALGRHLAALPDGERPTALWVSPYARTRATAADALAAGGLDLPVRVDERLRDRELGVLDRLTARGVAARFPAEAERRRHLGKTYHRPPGGESWSDVALRLRSWWSDVERREDHERLLVVTHDAVVVLLRAVLEGLDEDELMALVRAGSVRNASVTTLERRPDGRQDGGGAGTGAWRALQADEVGHLAGDAPVTEHPGRKDDA